MGRLPVPELYIPAWPVSPSPAQWLSVSPCSVALRVVCKPECAQQLWAAMQEAHPTETRPWGNFPCREQLGGCRLQATRWLPLNPGQRTLPRDLPRARRSPGPVEAPKTPDRKPRSTRGFSPWEKSRGGFKEEEEHAEEAPARAGDERVEGRWLGGFWEFGRSEADTWRLISAQGRECVLYKTTPEPHSGGEGIYHSEERVCLSRVNPQSHALSET